MSPMSPRRLTVGVALASLALAFCVSDALAAQTLVKFAPGFNLSTVKTNHVKLSRSGESLRLDVNHKTDWPGITIKATGGHWDLSGFQKLSLDVKNVGKNSVTISCRVDNPGADGAKHCVAHSLLLAAGKQGVLEVLLPRRLPDALKGKLFGMRGLPGGYSDSKAMFDPANVTQVLIFVGRPEEDHAFEIAHIRADGAAADNPPVDPAKLFPMIDAFGQYVHKDWPGKIHTAADFAARKSAEAADLAAHPGPSDWDQYGGWKSGPQLEATGFFRAERRDGRWWLVDPEGRLFWSNGIDCVAAGHCATPITDREHWFAALPAKGAPLAKFYGGGNWAPHNYYEGKSYRTYNFGEANLLRKYGDDWSATFNLLTHQRLRSWGLNTIGNWSDAKVYLLRKTPYTATSGISGTRLAGGQGYWRKFHDVFAPDFVPSVRKAMAGHKNKAAGDPWCLGFFIDNEESWDAELSLSLATLASPADQPAKKVFVADLKKKYETIEKLNAAWGTSYASWDALMQSTKTLNKPTQKKAKDDLTAFETKTAERYFEVCRNAVKEIAPHQLYLGCRFAWTNDIAVRAGAKYCDVVSFNRYEHSLANQKLAPDAVDKPIIIGEFHFGALDRGMFHTGLVPTKNQAERAAAYKTYVESALANPLIVGVHWFQFVDEATTGRGDGENYQIGFLDCCDTPYVETIGACRETAAEMYRYRSEAKD
jgi:hypothetical protein